MKTRAIIIMLTAALSLGIVTNCTKNPIAGNGTQTGNPNVASMLYNPGGSPAKHAKVVFYPINYNPRAGSVKKHATDAALDSTVTDTNGNYSIKLDSGTYTITATGDSGLAYQDSIKVINGDTAKLPSDTLKPAGRLCGTVRLEEGGDPTTIFILFMGTRTFTWPDDSSGSFTTDSMAKGKYRVRIITTLDNYKTLDTVFSVTSGRNDTMPNTIVLKYTGIPTPKNVALSYDTMKQIVMLTWDRLDTTLVASYNVYRRNVDSNTVFTRINTSPVTDTIYLDSTGVQDQTYEYVVAAVDKNNTEGTKSAEVSVMVVGAFRLLRTIKLDSLHYDPFAFFVTPDSNFYIAYRGNHDGFIGAFNSIGHNTKIIGSSKFIQLYDVALDSRGNVYAVDVSSNAIRKFSPSGDSLAKWNIQSPVRCVVDAHDMLFVMNGYNPRLVTKLDTAGNIFSTDTAVYSVNDVGDMTINSDGNILIKDGNTNTVLIFSNDLTSKNYTPFSLNGYLRGIDSSGNLYVKNDAGNINIYNQLRKQIIKWRIDISFDRLFIRGDKVYVLGNDSPLIEEFSIPY